MTLVTSLPLINSAEKYFHNCSIYVIVIVNVIRVIVFESTGVKVETKSLSQLLALINFTFQGVGPSLLIFFGWKRRPSIYLVLIWHGQLPIQYWGNPFRNPFSCACPRRNRLELLSSHPESTTTQYYLSLPEYATTHFLILWEAIPFI